MSTPYSQAKVLDILIASETVADKIAVAKQSIIELDKRRQQTREAIRNIEKCDDTSVWITVGSTLIKMNRKNAVELMRDGMSLVNIIFYKIINIYNYYIIICRSTKN